MPTILELESKRLLIDEPRLHSCDIEPDRPKNGKFDYPNALNRRVISVASQCLVLVVAFISGAIVILLWRPAMDPSLRLYSPVNHLVKYEPVRFNRSRGDEKTAYQGWPNEKIDSKWAELYSSGMLTALSSETASLLPERTERLPKEGREDEFIMTLDVFHQLHCLDIVRMALYRDRYDKHFYFANGTVDHCKWLHVDHCLDQIRQALVCSADVSVVYFAWSEVVQGLRPHVENQHICRNFEDILKWAKEREVEATDWHPSRRVVADEKGNMVIEQGRNHALDGAGECNAI